MKAVNLAYFTLKDYFRRTFLYAEVIEIAILLFLFRDEFRLLKAPQVFPALGTFALVLAVVTTLRITNLETNTRIYIPLTKAISRSAYLAGKTLAIFALNAVILIFLFILAFSLTELNRQFSFAAGLWHLVPIMLILMMSQCVMLCCSSLVSNKTGFFWGLILLILSLAQPWQTVANILPPINQLIISSYTGFSLGVITHYLIALAYAVIFYYLSIYLFGKRELNYEPK